MSLAQMSLFDVLPTDVVFEIIAAMPKADARSFMMTCSAAAVFTKDSAWFYEWVARRCGGYAHAMATAIDRHDPGGLRHLIRKAPKSVMGTMLLHRAVARSGPCVAALLCCPDIDPNARDAQRMAPLHLACVSNDAFTAALLAQHPRTDMNAAIACGWRDTPLHLAVHHRSLEVLGVLLQHPRVDVNARDAYGQTALHTATHNANAVDMRAMCVLLANPRVDVNARDGQGLTALHVVAGAVGVDGQTVALARVLLAVPGVDVNAQIESGATPLHMAAVMDNAPLALELVHTPGIDLNVVNMFGQTALELAMALGADGVCGAF